MKNLLPLILALLFAACNKDQTQEAALPELKNRPFVIGPEDEMGNVLGMYESLARKIEANASDLEARLTLAELFMQEARISGDHGYYYPEALALVEAVLAEQPEKNLKYRALLDKASVLLSLHRFADALATGEEAQPLNPYDAGIYGVLVDAHVELGNYSKAVEMADKMVSIRPDIRSYSRISYLREIHGQVDGAIEAMKLAVSAGYPGMEQTEWARLSLGHLYQRYDMPDSAMYHFQMALAARPNYPFAIAAIAGLEAEKGNMPEAEKMLQKACELIPEVGFFVEWASWEKQKGNTEKAAQLSRDILDMLADDDRSGHKMDLEYAHVYLELLDDPQKALSYAMKEYAARPDNIDVNKTLAQIYQRMGDQVKMQEHMDKALRTGSKDPELLQL